MVNDPTMPRSISSVTEATVFHARCRPANIVERSELCEDSEIVLAKWDAPVDLRADQHAYVRQRVYPLDLQLAHRLRPHAAVAARRVGLHVVVDVDLVEVGGGAGEHALDLRPDQHAYVRQRVPSIFSSPIGSDPTPPSRPVAWACFWYSYQSIGGSSGFRPLGAPASDAK